MTDDSLKVEFIYVAADATRRTVELKAYTFTPVRVDWGDGSAIETVPAASASGTADTTSGSPNLTNVNPTTGWQNGMAVSGPGIPAGTTILSGAGTATMVMSANATASAVGVAITGNIPTATVPLVQTHAYAKDGSFKVKVVNGNGLSSGFLFVAGLRPFPAHGDSEVEQLAERAQDARHIMSTTPTLG